MIAGAVVGMIIVYKIVKGWENSDHNLFLNFLSFRSAPSGVYLNALF
jgi:hypothetical protein